MTTIFQDMRDTRTGAIDQRRPLAQVKLPLGKMATFKFPVGSMQVKKPLVRSRDIDLVNTRQMRNLTKDVRSFHIGAFKY